jgi:hypothetical protein
MGIRTTSHSTQDITDRISNIMHQLVLPPYKWLHWWCAPYKDHTQLIIQGATFGPRHRHHKASTPLHGSLLMHLFFRGLGTEGSLPGLIHLHSLALQHSAFP